MTDSVNPGGGVRDADPYLTAGAIRYGGGDWIVPSAETFYASHEGLSGLPLNAFDASHSSDSHDVTIETGEAFVAGSWLGRDTTTSITLDTQVSNQTVSVGWKQGTANTVVIGMDAAFESEWPRRTIWEFDTDGSGVTADHDQRPVGEQIDIRNEGSAATADKLDDVDASNYARTDVSESFNADITTQGITANGGVDISDRLDVRAEHTHIRIHETDAEAQWNIGVSSGNLNLIEAGGDGLLQIRAGGDVDVRNGTITNERNAGMVTSGGSSSQRHIYTASRSPDSSDGQDGDIWLEY